jgi:sulfur carrier protein
MEITLNGEKREFNGAMTVMELLEALGLGEQMVLVEQNLNVIPRNEMAAVQVAEGDVIEVFRLAGGG